MKENDDLLMACHECDALQNVAHIPEGNIALCICCGERLFKNPRSAIENPLALIFSCAILFLVANIYPVMRLSIAGIEREATLTESALIFYDLGSTELALAVWLTSVILPAFCVFSLFYILLSIHFNQNWRFTKPLLVWASRLLPWGMMDVFLLAILVALVKLVSLADVVLGIGFTAFVALVLCYAAAISSIEMHILWDRLDKIRNGEMGE